MDGQMTIWDIFEPDTGNPLDVIPEEEMVQRIGLALGLTFKWHSYLEHYEAQCGLGIKASLNYSRYTCTGELEGKRYIGANVDARIGGCGAPCDSIEQAIRFLENSIRELKDSERKLREWRDKQRSSTSGSNTTRGLADTDSTDTSE